jgi:predicted phosphodiesterase
MRLWIVSDLHLELTRGWDLPAGAARPGFDAMIVAGDQTPRMERGVKWILQRVPDRPVIYIAGNHEGYGCDIDRTVEKARQAAERTKVFVLQNQAIRLGDVTFAGATLWTDFNLFGDQWRAMHVAGERMNDFKKIRVNRYVDRFRPQHALARHIESRAFLEAEMRKPRPGPLVVVTQLVEPDILTAAYRSDLTALMSPAADDWRGALRPADLWIHGHTHESFDAMIGVTRVVSNAKGYGPWMPRERTWDNPNFNPNYVIEI